MRTYDLLLMTYDYHPPDTINFFYLNYLGYLYMDNGLLPLLFLICIGNSFASVFASRLPYFFTQIILL